MKEISLRYYLLIFIYILTVSFEIFVGYTTGFPYPYYLHNFYLYQFAKQLPKTELPQGTYWIGKPYYAYGNFFGNSNKGNYFVARLVVSDYSLNELNKHFAALIFDDAESDIKGKPDRVNKIIKPVLNFNFSHSDEHPTSFIESLDPTMPISAKLFGVTQKEIWESKQRAQKIYLVCIIDSIYISNEFRCW